MKTFYKNISSCVINNGVRSPTFRLGRGVRLCHDKKSMYRRDIVNLGLVKITDLISANNSFSCDLSLFKNREQ